MEVCTIADHGLTIPFIIVAGKSFRAQTQAPAQAPAQASAKSPYIAVA